MDLFYVLLILLVVSRGFGEIAERLGQPGLVGELIAGIALGAAVIELPELFPQLSHIGDNEVFVTITDLGMFFLMLFAGVEMQPHRILEHSVGALAVAIGGMLVPLGLGLALGWYFLPESELYTAQCLFLGTALAITAVPATVRILAELGQLETIIGQTIISAAIFDDILSLVLLAWLTALLSAGSTPGLEEFLILFGKVGLFFAVTAFFGLYVFPRGGRLMRYLKTEALEISAVLISAFAFAVFAEMLGLHFIIGAFMAGLYFGRKTINTESYNSVKHAISAMTFGFLAPIFFASIGLNLNISALSGAPLFLVILILVAFFGKIFGAGIAARAFGFSARDAGIIGVGMSPRGAVELVIAGIAMKAGLFETNGQPSPIVENLFSAVVIMAVVTTVVSPIILNRVFRKGRR